MRSLFTVLLLGVGIALGQNSSPSAPSKSQKPNSTSAGADKSSAHNPNLTPPRSDSVDAASLGDDRGDSSSKDTQIDLSPPKQRGPSSV